ncbi:hypothetical protein M885DRAFT_532964 [Pelagophyceae sp. CCMP2097]|nr:hypothetical protein M885DRAFT_532964 [Pelagophyceae sp. CCMP2097]
MADVDGDARQLVPASKRARLAALLRVGVATSLLARCVPRVAAWGTWNIVLDFLGRRDLIRRAPAAAPPRALPAPPPPDDDEDEDEDHDNEEEEEEEEDEADDEDDGEDDAPETRLARAVALCADRAHALEAANVAEKAALFAIAREGAALRSASLQRERQRSAEVSASAAAARAGPAKRAAGAWRRLGGVTKGALVEVRDSQGLPWVVRVVGVAPPAKDGSMVASRFDDRAAFPPGARGPRGAGGFLGALLVEPLLDPNRLAVDAAAPTSGGLFDRLLPRHGAWPRHPHMEEEDEDEDDGEFHHHAFQHGDEEDEEVDDDMDEGEDDEGEDEGRPRGGGGGELRAALAHSRLLTLDRLANSRVVDDCAAVAAIERDVAQRRVVVHYFLDAEGEACPVRVEPPDVPMSQYRIDYERESALAQMRRALGFEAGLAHAAHSAQLLAQAHAHNRFAAQAPANAPKLRVRHAASGAQLKCLARRARSNSISLDPIELFTAPFLGGLNVLHLHVNALGDDACLDVLDVRDRPEYRELMASRFPGDDDAAFAGVQAAVLAIQAEGFGADASGRALDYKVISDGAAIVAVLIADEGGSGGGMKAAFFERPTPAPGSIVQLPDGALGRLRSPLPRGLVIRAGDGAETEVEVREEDEGNSATFRDHRCRNCGSKGPEALPGLVTVDVLSLRVPRVAGADYGDDSDDVSDAGDEPPVDPATLATVLEMGFSDARARKAIAATLALGGGADAAVQWLLSEEAAPSTECRAPRRPRATAAKLLDAPRRTEYPVCCVRLASDAQRRGLERRLEARIQSSAETAADDLVRLEALVQGGGGAAALRDARALKTNVDAAMESGKLAVEAPRLARIDRGLRALAFS